MEMKLSFFYAIAAAVMVLASSVVQTSGQSDSCLSQLAPCLNYLNGSKEVPQVCCNPLKSVIRNNPKCLCHMLTNRGSSQAERAGINLNDAQMLPARCGEHVNPLACLTRTGSGGSSNSDQSSSSGSSFSQSNLMTALGFAVTILSSILRIS